MPEEVMYSISDTKLTAIADAIREAKQTESLLTTDDMVTAINNMLNCTSVFVGYDFDVDLEGNKSVIPVDSSKVQIEVLTEPEFETYDPTTDGVFCQLTYSDAAEGEEPDYRNWEPVGGVYMRRNNTTYIGNSTDVILELVMENADDPEEEPLVFTGSQTGNIYSFYGAAPWGAEYTISFSEWPEEPITYNCHLKVYSNDESFPLENNEPAETEEFEFILYPMDHYDWPEGE